MDVCIKKTSPILMSKSVRTLFRARAIVAVASFQQPKLAVLGIERSSSREDEPGCEDESGYEDEPSKCTQPYSRDREEGCPSEEILSPSSPGLPPLTLSRPAFSRLLLAALVVGGKGKSCTMGVCTYLV